MTGAHWDPPRDVVSERWLLDDLMPELTPVVAREERSRFAILAGSEQPQIVLVGAGNLGRRTAAGLRRVGVQPIGFVDNDTSRIGTVTEGLPVDSPRDAVRRYDRDVAFVVTIWTPMGPLAYPAIARQLRALGRTSPVPFVPLFWRYQEEFLPNFCLDLPHRIFENADRVKAAYRALGDDESRLQFRTQLAYLLSTMDTVEIDIPSGSQQYFPDDLISLHPSEVFVDCGAYDGDSLDSFVKATHGDFRLAIAFEPDPSAVARLRTAIDTKPAGIRDRIHVRQRAIGESHGLVRFAGSGTPTSHISDHGDLEVESVSLDDAVYEYAPTFIKMDIEGAEESALRGAARTIRDHRPILAISVYHVQEHLYRLPELMGGVCRDYALFLRRLGPDGDLVCFAIPNERRRG